MTSLPNLAAYLEAHPAILEKAGIHRAWQPAARHSHDIPLGDDCAAIPQPDGSHLLFAAEGMLESFIRSDPWFAGYSAVMVNLSDIASMGGRPIAITDIITSPSDDMTSAIWEGMLAASERYAVPIVGGHTTRSTGTAALAASVIGRAGPNLLTSFDADPGDLLVIAIDMQGAYRGDDPFWNASTTATPEHLRRTLALLPTLADSRLSSAAKDISNGGIIGTLAMFCQTSRTGVMLDLDALPIPENTSFERWLTSFPSYGYLLAVPGENLAATRALFTAHGITCQPCGQFTADHRIILARGGETHALTF